MRLPADFDDDERALFESKGAVLPAAGAGCPKPDVLQAAMEGVLPEGWQQQVDTHVASCGLCTMLTASLREAEAEPLTPLESRRIRSRLSLPPLAVVRSEKPRQPWWSRGWAAAGLAIAGAAAAITTLIIFNPERPRQQQPVAERKPASQPEPVPQPQVASVKPRLPLTAAPLRLPLGALTMRGEEPGTDQAYLQKLGAALKPYRAASYKESAAALAVLATAYPEAVEPPFYEGVSLLFLDKPADAAARLERARSLANQALAGEIPWYLAIAYERSGRGAESQALLQAVCAATGPHRAEACKIASEATPGAGQPR
ncbi:MAG: hypothetical protein JNK87_29580 [Bryobacterales bacterium]|nr:hypothetical protein [Bryobacterales bacterium]